MNINKAKKKVSISESNLKQEIMSNDIRFYIEEQEVDNALKNEIEYLGEDSTILDDKTRFDSLKVGLLALGNHFEADDFKELIAGYFASKSFNNISVLEYGKAQFQVLSPYNSVLDNIIAEIAQVVFDKNIAQSLLTGPEHLMIKINEATGRHGLGERFIDELFRLLKSYEECQRLEKIVSYNRKFQEKLETITKSIEFSKTFGGCLELAMNVLEYNDFDFKSTFIKDGYVRELELSESEKDIIRKYEEIYDQRGLRFRESRCAASALSSVVFINKVDIVCIDFENQLSIKEKKFLNDWERIQRLILKVIVPAANKVSGIDTFDVDKLLSYASYESCDKKFSLESDTKVQRLHQKLKTNKL